MLAMSAPGGGGGGEGGERGEGGRGGEWRERNGEEERREEMVWKEGEELEVWNWEEEGRGREPQGKRE